MPFNSYEFLLLYLPLVVLGYYALNRLGWYNYVKYFLVFASFVFYGYSRWQYLFIIIISIVANYLLCNWLLRKKSRAVRNFLLVLALLLNVGILFYFKYYDFVASSVNNCLNGKMPLLHLALPLGISFFTLSQLSYVIDCYKESDAIRCYGFMEYALYVSYFPKLLSGPIATHGEIIPQFTRAVGGFSSEYLASGLYGFSMGLAKKVLIADSLGRAVDVAFNDVGALNYLTAWFIMLAYTMQIYFDFSGYCDMAVGIARMMNIDIPLNFNSPYRATSIVDFWKRWHITLTRFFTKYIYIPLGGSRHGALRTYLNILIVFLVSGIWHGANWTFILWGMLNGVAMIATRLMEGRMGVFARVPRRLKTTICWCFTFLLVNLLWVLFRANSVSEALLFYRRLFALRGGNFDWKVISGMEPTVLKPISYFFSIPSSMLCVCLVAIALAVSILGKSIHEKMHDFRPSYSNCILSALLLAISILSFGGISSFLYWKF